MPHSSAPVDVALEMLQPEMPSEMKRRKTTEFVWEVDQGKANSLVKQLSTRLRYAKLKVEYGWQRQNINEVENLYFHHSMSRKMRAPASWPPKPPPPMDPLRPNGPPPPSPQTGSPSRKYGKSRAQSTLELLQGRPRTLQFAEPANGLAGAVSPPLTELMDTQLVLPGRRVTPNDPTLEDINPPSSRSALLPALVPSSSRPDHAPGHKRTLSEAFELPIPKSPLPSSATPPSNSGEQQSTFAIAPEATPSPESANAHASRPTNSRVNAKATGSSRLRGRPATTPIPPSQPLPPHDLTYDSFWSSHSSSNGNGTGAAGPSINRVAGPPDGYSASILAKLGIASSAETFEQALAAAADGNLSHPR